MQTFSSQSALMWPSSLGQSHSLRLKQRSWLTYEWREQVSLISLICHHFMNFLFLWKLKQGALKQLTGGQAPNFSTRSGFLRPKPFADCSTAHSHWTLCGSRDERCREENMILASHLLPSWRLWVHVRDDPLNPLMLIKLLCAFLSCNLRSPKIWSTHKCFCTVGWEMPLAAFCSIT